MPKFTHVMFATITAFLLALPVSGNAAVASSPVYQNATPAKLSAVRYTANELKKALGTTGRVQVESPEILLAECDTPAALARAGAVLSRSESVTTWVPTKQNFNKEVAYEIEYAIFDVPSGFKSFNSILKKSISACEDTGTRTKANGLERISEAHAVVSANRIQGFTNSGSDYFEFTCKSARGIFRGDVAVDQHSRQSRVFFAKAGNKVLMVNVMALTGYSYSFPFPKFNSLANYATSKLKF